MKSIRLLSIVLFSSLISGCMVQLADLAVDLERWRSNLTEKNVTIEGFNISYLEGGEGPTVLMLHGFGGSMDHWTRFSRYLSSNFHVIALDLPGFGDSSRLEGVSYNSAAQAERLEKFLQKLGIGKVHILGNSMGGMIATAFAYRFSEHILSVTLLDTGGIRSPQPSDLYHELKEGRNPLLIEKREDLDRLMNFSFVNPPSIPSPVLDVLYERSAKYHTWNSHIFNEIAEEGSVVQRLLPKITSPLLVVWGANDRILNVSATQVIAEIRKDAVIHILDQCGHAPMLEKPEETANLFIDFVKAKTVAIKAGDKKVI